VKNLIESRGNTISQVETIHNNRGYLIRQREKIVEIVETPLIKSCEDLYDLNIKTLEASANPDDLGR
jgi:hypothetical protein